MTTKDFFIVAKNQFSFLELKENFKLSKCEKENWGYELTYLNDTTGVKITYEYREAYIFIMLYELIDGSLKENPRNIEDNTILYAHSLDDIILLQNPDDLIKPTYEYNAQSKYFKETDELSLYIAAFSNNLKLYAKDILRGDFKNFQTLDSIVKERVKKNKH